MYRVVTIALSRDGRQAGRHFGTEDRGDLASGELMELLRGFEKATSAEREESEIRISCASNSGVVRSVNGQLLFRSSREAHLREHPLGPMDIIDHLDRSTTWTPFVPNAPKITQEAAHRDSGLAAVQSDKVSLPGLILSLAALLGGAVGFCVAIRVAYATPKASPAPPIAAYDDKTEETAARRNVVGVFATGPAVGDRTITVKPGGILEMVTLGAKGPMDQVLDTYRVALRSGDPLEGPGRTARNGDDVEPGKAPSYPTLPCLVTAHNGIIDLQGTDTLVYCRDLYHRLPPAKE